MRRAGVILGLLTLLWAVDAAVGIGVFWEHDLRHHHIPWRVWAAGEWAQLRVPLYSDAVGNGFALGADAQTGVFYPPTMLLFGLLSPAHAVNASILGHIWLAGVGMRRLMVALGHPDPGALLGAVAFAFSGFMAAHTGYLGMQNAIAWLPFVLTGVVTGRWAQTGLCAALMMVAGHPQIAVIGLMLAGAVALWRGTWRMFTVGLLIALIAASPQILATLELLEGSMRAGGVGAAFSRIGALPVAELINGVLPEFFGFERPADMPQSYFHRGGGYWGGGANHWESAFYLGLPVVVLACLGVVRQRFWVGVCVLSVLLMVGSPLWAALGMLPVFDAMRFPVRFSVVLTLAVAVLAGAGLNRALIHPHLDKIAGRIGVVVGLFALGLAGAGGLFAANRVALKSWLNARYTARAEVDQSVLSGQEALDAPAVAQRVEQIIGGATRALDPMLGSNLWAVAVLVLVGVLLWLRAQGRLRAPVLAVSLIALSYADLWSFGSDYNPRTAAAQLHHPPAAVARLGVELKDGRIGVVDRRRHPSLDWELLSSNIGLQFGLSDVLVPSPLLNVRNEALLRRVGLDVGDRGPQKWRLVLDNLNIVSMMGVRWLLSEHPVSSAALTEHMRTPVSVYENTLALPRDFLVGCTTVTDDPWAALDTLDPRTTAIVEVELGLPDCHTPIQNARFEVLTDMPTERVYTVSNQTPALFVQIETHGPGWQAELDGVSVPIHRVNWNFRGVSLPAGTHTLRLHHSPAWLSAALPFSALAWLGLLVGCGRRRGHPGEEE